MSQAIFQGISGDEVVRQVQDPPAGAAGRKVKLGCRRARVTENLSLWFTCPSLQGLATLAGLIRV